MRQLCVCREIEPLGSLESTQEAAPRATLTPLSCSPNFPRAQYLDIRTLTHEQKREKGVSFLFFFFLINIILSKQQ